MLGRKVLALVSVLFLVALGVLFCWGPLPVEFLAVVYAGDV